MKKRERISTPQTDFYIADKINRLRELKQNALTESAQREGLQQRITEMLGFLDEKTGMVEEYDE